MIFPCNSTLPLKQKLKLSEPSRCESSGGLAGAGTELHARAPPSGALKGSPTRLQLGKLGCQWEETQESRVSGEVGKKGCEPGPDPRYSCGWHYRKNKFNKERRQFERMSSFETQAAGLARPRFFRPPTAPFR